MVALLPTLPAPQVKQLEERMRELDDGREAALVENARLRAEKESLEEGKENAFQQLEVPRRGHRIAGRILRVPRDLSGPGYSLLETQKN